MSTFLDNFTSIEIENIIMTSTGYNEVMNRLNVSHNSGSSRQILRAYMKEHSLSDAHFIRHTSRLPEEIIFCQNSRVSQKALRERVKSSGVIPLNICHKKSGTIFNSIIYLAVVIMTR